MRRRLLCLAAVLLVAACEDTLPPDTVPVSMDGIWDFTAVFTEGSATCHDTGSLRLSQLDSTFAGRVHTIGSCTTPTGTYFVERNDTVTDGTISGDVVTFTFRLPLQIVSSCQVSADVTGSGPAVALSGMATCGAGAATFHALPQAPVDDVTIVPSDLVRVVGGQATYVAEVRARTNHRAFFRPLTWSTGNPAIATIDSTGTALATGPGTVSVTAATEGVTANAILFVEQPIALATVNAGNAYSCAVAAPTSSGGDVWCWGMGRRAPLPLNSGLAFLSVTTTTGLFVRSHCGLVPGGAAYCWGDNDDGQLGDGSTMRRDGPAAVSGGRQYMSLSAGGAHVCAISMAGDLYCWGRNDHGQLGDGTTTTRPAPVQVGAGRVYHWVSAGLNHTCAISAGTAYCWGDNATGQLGDSTQTRRLVPTPVAGGLTFNTISAGTSHSCAVEQSGQGRCWGSNDRNQLGNGGGADVLAPVVVSGGLTWNAISAGSIHSCGLAGGGAAYCWGWNAWGQLGTGNFTGSPVPVAVAGGRAYVSISAGMYLYSDEWHNSSASAHTCAVAGDAVYCWGENNLGQLGDGTTTERTVPTKVLGQP